MNILYLQNSKGYHIDLKEALKKREHTLIIEEIPDKEMLLLQQLTENKGSSLMEKLTANNWDIIFTLDYYPCISMLCQSMNKHYVSWSLEPPFSNLYSSTIVNSANVVFTADKWLAECFQREGIKNIFYLPEGVNLERCNAVKNNLQGNRDIKECSMIGKCRIPSWQELFQTEHILDATLGYLEGILVSQNLIYGHDLWSGALPDYLYKDLIKNSNIHLRTDSVQSIQDYYAEQCFYPRTTVVDRTIAVKVLASKTQVSLYSDDESFQYDNVLNYKMPVYDDKFEIIRTSQINVNISPRGLKDGIYGHALQIMGMGGFMITDYRREMEEEFIAGEDFIIYEDMKHLADRVEYYLKRPEEREEIGRRAYNKIAEKHTLEQRIQIIEQRIESLK